MAAEYDITQNLSSNPNEQSANSREVIRKASKSFYFASLMLPQAIRPDVEDLYAFLRFCDDCVDCEDGSITMEQKRAFIREVSDEFAKPPRNQTMPRFDTIIDSIDNIYDTYETFSTFGPCKSSQSDFLAQGYPLPFTLPLLVPAPLPASGMREAPAMTKFRSLQERYQFSPEVTELFAEGMVWDLDDRRYETLPDVVQYCIRVASVVGIYMCFMMKTTDEDSLFYASCLGIGMQLTNIARDVGEDLSRGRMYLPLQWLPDSLAERCRTAKCPRPDELTPAEREAILAATKRLLEAADNFYIFGNMGITRLPPNCQLAVRTASSIYQEIGQRVRHNGCNSLDQRAFVPLSRKLALFVQVLFIVMFMRMLVFIGAKKVVSRQPSPCGSPRMLSNGNVRDTVITSKGPPVWYPMTKKVD